jgi:hypothetical protein
MQPTPTLSSESQTNIHAPSSSRLSWQWLLVFYLWLGIITGAVSFLVRPVKVEEASQLQRTVWTSFGTYKGGTQSDNQIFKGTATRIFMPGLMAGVVKVTGLSWPRVFSLLRLLTIVLAYIIFHWYLRGWFSQKLAMLGTLCVAATLPLTFNNFFEYPTDFPELITFTLGLWCIREKRYGLLCLVIALGTLNRETTVFLPLILLLVEFDRKNILRLIPKIAAAGFAWLIPLAFLRWWTGIGAVGVYGDSISHNFQGIAAFAANFNPYNNYLFYLYLFGPLWILPFIYWRREPPFFRRALCSVPAFLIVYSFLGGFWDEPREIINMYPLLLPAGLFALFKSDANELSASGVLQ